MWDLQLSGTAAILAGLALLPGLIAVLIRDALLETGERDVKRLLVSAAVYDAVIFCALLALQPLGMTPFPIKTSFNPMTIPVAVALALLLGALTGAAWLRKLWQALLFRSRWSKKGTVNTWVDAFQHAEEAGAWALVHLKDGRRIMGVPKYYSASGTQTSIYLVRGPIGGEPVTIYAAGSMVKSAHDGPGILITPSAEVALVEFLDGRKPE